MSAVTLRGEEASWDLYTVTSNHVHLIIRDAKGEEVIPQTIQLIARRTVQ
jgi:hypothetical protein